MNIKSRYYVRIVAGGYLMYQGYRLVKNALEDHISIIFPLFGVAFLAFGLAIGVSALLALHRISQEEAEMGEGQQQGKKALEIEENQADEGTSPEAGGQEAGEYPEENGKQAEEEKEEERA